MGTEILDSSRGTRSIAPELALEPATESTTPLVELEELQPPTPRADEAAQRRLEPLTYLRGLGRDPERRRTTIRTAAVCILLMALTASVVQFRAQRQINAEASGRVAVDVRLDEVRPTSRSFDLNGAPANGSVTARIEMHNLGPADVRLVGLDVTNGSQIATVNDIDDTSAALGPGRAVDTSYEIDLPCRRDQRRGLGSPELSARIMTSDGQVHNVPVNMTAVNQTGGLLVACIASDDEQNGPITSYASTTDGTTVVMTIVTGGGLQQVSLITPDIGVPLQFTSVPTLPTIARAGVPLTVKVVPSVGRCPRGPINFDALQGIGVLIGNEQMSDNYLPALVAQAVGRACGQRR